MMVRMIKIVTICLAFTFLSSAFAQSDFIDEVTTAKTAEERNNSDNVCPYCGNKGYCEIAGEKIPCPVCNGKNNIKTNTPSTIQPKPSKENKTNALPITTKTEAYLPWEPANPPSIANKSHPQTNIKTKEATTKTEAIPTTNKLPPSGEQLLLLNTRDVSAAAVNLNTLWGTIPFARQNAYQSNLFRGPGFSISIPKSWKEEVKPYTILDGTQHRYTSPDGYNYIVVVVFPMIEDVDLANFLQSKHAKMLSSFKNKSARNVILARRRGLGCFYEGILLMRDVACNLFFTRYKKKGYMIYGLYFDRQGGLTVAEIMQSLRIY